MALQARDVPAGASERAGLPDNFEANLLMEHASPSSQAALSDQKRISDANGEDDKEQTEIRGWSTLLEDLKASELQRKREWRAKLVSGSEDALSEIVPDLLEPSSFDRNSLEGQFEGDILNQSQRNHETVPGPLEQSAFGRDDMTDQSEPMTARQSGDLKVEDSSQGQIIQNPVLQLTSSGATSSHAPHSKRRICLRLCFAFMATTMMSALMVVSFASFLLFWEHVNGLLQSEYAGGDQRTGCKVLSRDVDLRTAKLCGTDALRALQPVAGHSAPSHRQTKGELCRFVYYWVAVLQVEFWPKSASLPTRAFAEKPGALLVESCRPGFREVWNVKEGYRINGTYACTYNQARLQQVDLEGRNFSSCPQNPGVRQAHEVDLLNPLAGKILELVSNIGTVYQSFADLLSPEMHAADKMLERGLWLFFVFVASLRLTQRLTRKRATTLALLNPSTQRH
ncbi:hypothetical protein KFL_007130030 [Klebsormidium nitens]|uniref:Uncharacterized protein n=1 Tax=Klebsormidium nitens TaxID=105231 RepID=A0A1Y1IJQ0_KLENI|nr:hypothetical protein KFL_007130030 [Klebsormidium nitens]|eukprot:GAQ91014.1 hypothetical protein KFL_007130030 [Klebsormidium nitens]